MSQTDPRLAHVVSNMTGPRFVSTGRLLLAAAVAACLLPAVYFAFPPIFADVESAPEPVAAGRPAESISFPELPEIPLTPSIQAHRRSIELIQQGVRRLRQITAYTATFTKVEVIGGERTSPQKMHLKLRHDPFSVYLRWISGKPGQELLYAAGQHDGKMLVRAGGFKGIFGAVRLEVDGSMAMSQARYPVTQLGLLNLAQRVLDYRYREADWTDGYTCTIEPGQVAGRPCYRVTTIYESRSRRPEYRKSQLWIDKESLAITKIRNFGWPEDGADSSSGVGPMLEEYTYTKIDLSPDLTPRAFSASNQSYRLLRR